MTVEKKGTSIFTEMNISGPTGDQERNALEILLASTSLEDRIAF